MVKIIKVKIHCALLAVMMAVPFVLSSCKSLDNEVNLRKFILPTGFEGPFIIIYDLQNGQSPILENGIETFIVPSDRVLTVTVKLPSNPIRYSFYRDDGTGHRKEIPFSGGCREDRSNQVVACIAGHFKVIDGKPVLFRYDAFFIGPLNKDRDFGDNLDNLLGRLAVNPP